MHPRARMCCFDLDTFFVSVERLLDPSLEGRPVVVGGRRGSRGVVTACSYEVRRFGVRSGMSMREASQRAPQDAVFLPSRHGVYSPYSTRVRAVLERFTPVVRAASIDEFYLDLSGCERIHREPQDVDDDQTIERTVRAMCQAVRDEVGLPASAGIGGTKIIAKIASGRAKPAGVLLVPKGMERSFLRPLPVRSFPGIGPQAEARMAEAGLHTLADLVDGPAAIVRGAFAPHTAMVEREMRGEGSFVLGRERPAFHEHDPTGTVGSISNERTFFAALDDEARVEKELLALTERVCWRARKRRVRARTVTLKLRTTDFHTVTRSLTGPPSADEAVVRARVAELYRRARTRALPIRLVGIALSNFVDDGGQLALPFTRHHRIGSALDAIRQSHGYDAVRLGATGGGGRFLEVPDAEDG